LSLHDGRWLSLNANNVHLLVITELVGCHDNSVGGRRDQVKLLLTHQMSLSALARNLQVLGKSDVDGERPVRGTRHRDWHSDNCGRIVRGTLRPILLGSGGMLVISGLVVLRHPLAKNLQLT